jgi:hypothetical protein
MSVGSEAADQAVRNSIQITEAAVKLAGLYLDQSESFVNNAGFSLLNWVLKTAHNHVM